jgi:CBS domain-containing protein
MKASELMTAQPCCASADDSARDVAQLMRDNDCGSVPVVDQSGCVVGIVTDRDLAIRALADGKDGSTRVRELMTASPRCCDASDDIEAVERTMSDLQVRRIPVVDADGRCVGIISQADLARAANRDRVTEHEVAIVVQSISDPNAGVSRGRPEQRL